MLVDYTSYQHATAALRSGACAALVPSIAIQEFFSDRFITWSLDPIRLKRPPISLIWNPRNASIRPVVATLVEVLPGLLSFQTGARRQVYLKNPTPGRRGAGRA